MVAVPDTDNNPVRREKSAPPVVGGEELVVPNRESES